ncbi:peptide/nickel transport system substrate-binding protein [Antricoccus suffuscus]|uniref:Peptide/nickel transport system substrate-binding protein n=1 Tax=Antricoccus suffuscus TaxID=1629062 RepID=A0A2T0ZYN7_9ACTN|nr:ABC transporter substrate-binding protein [Antricoccus suffuscus]PRZ41465.1 peptide/nickel transport system substrate-binding protein [Antricoccus suffuscus]
MVKRRITVVLIAIVTLLATACGSGGGAGSPSASDTVIIGTTQVPRTLIPAVQSGFATALPGAQLFASPVYYDDSFDPKPYLAKSWEFTDDKKQLTLHLVKDAKFHDETPITSEDVAFSIGLVKAHHPFGEQLFGKVTSVDTPDPQTVVIHLSSPSPAIMIAMSPLFLPVMPKHIYEKVDNWTNSPLNLSDVVGSGPYKLVSYDKGSKLVLKKFDDFFMKDRVKVNNVIYQFFPEANSLVLGMQSGELNLTASSSPSTTNQLKKISGVTVADKGYEGVGYMSQIDLNLKSKYLSDVKVREAIRMAIDVKGNSKQLYDGAVNLARGPIAPGSPYFDKKINDKYSYDTKKAGALLDDAGYPKDGSGKRFELRLTYIPGIPDSQQGVANLVKENLAKIGIVVNLETAPDFPTWSNKVANFDYDMTVDAQYNWGDPSIGVDRQFLCNNIRPGVVWANMAQYCNPKADALLSEAASATDEKTRKGLYDQFQDIVTDDIPYIWMTDVPLVNAYNQTVSKAPNGIWGLMSPMFDMTVTKK